MIVPEPWGLLSQHKVMCDNTLGVATAIMSGLTGGTVQCESLPDVSEFLKKRNKQKHNQLHPYL